MASLFSLALLLASLFGGAIFTAADTATNAPDTTSTREITLHAVDSSQSSQNILGNNDGSVLDTSNQQMLANVGFSAVKIVPATGYTVVTMSASNPATYNTEGTAITAKTDSTGTATLSIGTGNGNDGYYLVTQTTSTDGITGTAPFIVQVPLNSTGTSPDGTWTYDVNVYPKLNVEQYSDPDKTIDLNDGTNTDKQGSVFAGQEVTWNLAINFSQSMRISNSDGSYTYGSVEFKDTLNSNLTYQSISFSVALQNDSSNAFSSISSLTLSSGTDYTLSTSNGSIDLKLTTSGIDKVLAALPTETSTNHAVFMPNITTTVSSAYTYGEIGNSFIPELMNAYGINLNSGNNSSNPTTVADPDAGNNPNETPDLYLGALTISKVDSVAGTPLSGATFGIATTQTNAENKDFVQQAADGTLYADKEAVPAGVATTNYTKTTDSNGKATFVGLQLQDGTSVTTAAKANTTYYVTEISAPSGYNLPNAPFEVTAGISNVTNDLTNNLNGSNIHLPFTGGEGMIGLIIIAGVAATASIVIRRRSNTK